MADRFRVHVEGASEIETLLHRLQAKAGDLTPLMQMIGTQIETSVEDNFRGGHDPAGIPWPKSRRAKETGGKTLIDSAILKGSITSRASASSVEVGSNVVYAGRHNQGWSGTEQVRAHKRTMTQVFGVKLANPKEITVSAFNRTASTPKREFLGLSIHDQQDVVGIIEDYFGLDD